MRTMYYLPLQCFYKFKTFKIRRFKIKYNPPPPKKVNLMFIQYLLCPQYFLVTVKSVNSL